VPPQRKLPILDGYILASVHQIGYGLGNYDDEGHYSTLVIRGLASRPTAQEWKRGLYRAALYLTRHGTPVSVSMAKIARDGLRGWKITYRVSDKDKAKAHQLAAHGSDKSRWAYDPSGYDPRRYTGGSG
jgi:hypothetical protein